MNLFVWILLWILQLFVTPSVGWDVQKLDLRTGAWGSVESVVRNVSAFHRGLMGTRTSALATGTSKTPRARISALNRFLCLCDGVGTDLCLGRTLQKYKRKLILLCNFYIISLSQCQIRVDVKANYCYYY